jgi:heptosyltransferase-2
MNLLVLALSGIGDALMFTPTAALIKKHRPDVELDALVMYHGVVDIYQRSELFRKVTYFNFLEEGAVRSLQFVFSLRNKYDASISVYPANRFEYNMINFLVGAKRRAGVRYLRRGSTNLGFLNNVRIIENDDLHNVEENIRLAEELLQKKFPEKAPLIFNLNDDDVKFAEDFFANHQIRNNKPVIGFHAGCSTLKNHIKRRWEPEKFIELGKRLIDKYQAQILIFGGRDEKELKKTIVDGINSTNVHLANGANLAQSAALIKKCDMFVTNDSSLMHTAAAMKRKVVAIIGPTNRNYIYPWETEHTIVSLGLDCAPCFYYSPKPLTCSRADVQFKCIHELSVDNAESAVAAYLQSGKMQ